MKLLVDTRGTGEDKVFETAKLLLADTGYTVEKKALDVGDYHILNKDGELCVVVERKSHGDMATSLQSKNHMKEQVYRLRALAAQSTATIVFIVYEGPMSLLWYDGKTGAFDDGPLRTAR